MNPKITNRMMQSRKCFGTLEGTHRVLIILACVLIKSKCHHSIVLEMVLELTFIGCLLYSTHYLMWSTCLVNSCKHPMRQAFLTTLVTVEEMRHREDNLAISRSYRRSG